MEASKCTPLRRDTLPWAPPSPSTSESSDKFRRHTARSQPRRCGRMVARNLTASARCLAYRHWAASHLAAHSSHSPCLQSRCPSDPRPLKAPHARVRPAASPWPRTNGKSIHKAPGRRKVASLRAFPPQPVDAASINRQLGQPGLQRGVRLPYGGPIARHGSVLGCRAGELRGAGASNSGSDSDSDSEGRFWDGEEGRRKLDEIGGTESDCEGASGTGGATGWR